MRPLDSEHVRGASMRVLAGNRADQLRERLPNAVTGGRMTLVYPRCHWRRAGARL